MNLQAPHDSFTHSAPESVVDRQAKVAIVHDWCPAFRGGERVLERLCRQFADPAVFTLFDFLSDEIKQRHFPGVKFHVSPINGWPLVHRYYRHLFFACPFLIEQFDVTSYDAVISSSAAFARGVLTRPDQPHLCYVHSPARYAWDEQFSYLAQGGLGHGPKGLLYRYMLHRLRNWDVSTAHGPDLMIANSRYVRARIHRVYRRDSLVIHPPVDTDEMPFRSTKDTYYVAASYLAPYKRTDLVIEAFNQMPARRLLVVGEGQQSAKLRKLAGRNVTFSGYLPRPDYVDAIANAKAMVYAGCEDFGIALAEAQACGTPLVAYGRGGACDIVQSLGASEAPTGVLFADQTAAAIREAVETFERHIDAISPSACQRNASRFNSARFDREIASALVMARAMNADRMALPPQSTGYPAI